MITKQVDVVASENGLCINGTLIDKEQPLERYREVLGIPNRIIDAGPPPPVGHRSNRVHVFDSLGVYLTEHHASRLIESVNFVFDPSDSAFPIERAFGGDLKVDGQHLRANLPESHIDRSRFAHDLPGEYSVKHKNCWIGISAKGRRGADGKRREPRYVVRVSVCF